MHRRVTLSIRLLVLQLLVLSGQDLVQLYDQLRLDVSLPATAQAKSALVAGNTKIDAGLRRLVGVTQAKSPAAVVAGAKSLDIPESAGLIGVTAVAEGNGLQALIGRIEELGGEVTAELEDSVLARVPPGAVENLGELRELTYLSAQSTFRLAQISGPARSAQKGVMVTKAHLFHDRGIRGRGVTIGILDFGFSKYRTLLAQRLVPAPKAARVFGRASSWNQESGTEHGTACAEIIHAMAPEAEIVIAMVGDGSGAAATDEIIQAGRWLAEQGVAIVSFSGGGHGGPHNGKDIMDKLVAEVAGKGVLWVNAAGNEGGRHWSGAATLNEKGLIKIGPRGEPYLLIKAMEREVRALVSWDDWGPNPSLPSSTQDVDAFLGAINQQTGQVQIVSESTNPQNGRGRPQELVATHAQPGQLFALFLRGTRLSRPVRVHVHQLSPGLMQPQNASGSIGIPATSELALAVGAVHVDSLALEPYSSQGPTDDGRNKPEVAAPANTPSAAYAGRFSGTSAACPHVSGFAALLKQMDSTASERQLFDSVLAATTDLGIAGVGRGVIDGSKTRLDRLPDGPAGDRIEIPSYFGAFVSKSAIDRLTRNAAAEGYFGDRVAVERANYQVGDPLRAGFRAREAVHYMLLHRNARGQYTLLAPKDGDPAVIEPNHIYKLDEIEITAPTGVEQIFLICARDAVNLESYRPDENHELSIAMVSYTVREER